MRKSPALILVFLISIFATELFGQAVVPRPFMTGYARVTSTRSGQSVIYYNPRAMRRVGPDVSRFILAHEQAHLRLGHLNRPVSRRRAEYEADILAARMVPQSSVVATTRWFAQGNGGSLIHGSPIQRARRVYRFGGTRR